MRRPQLLEKIKISQAMLRNRRTLSDADYVLRQSELEEQEQAIKNELKTYVIRYMKSITILLSDEYDERIRKIINKRDVHGNTPLHYAATQRQFKICKFIIKNIKSKKIEELPSNIFYEWAKVDLEMM